jgi:hypothetical protein
LNKALLVHAHGDRLGNRFAVLTEREGAANLAAQLAAEVRVRGGRAAHHQLVPVGQEHLEDAPGGDPRVRDAREEGDAHARGEREVRVARARDPGRGALKGVERRRREIPAFELREHALGDVHRGLDAVLVEPVPAPRACEPHVRVALH